MQFNLKDIFDKFRKPAASPAGSVPPEFDLRRRTEIVKEKLYHAAKLAEMIGKMGMEFDYQGYSTGGFTASIATTDGQPDGTPKMDPVTVNVADKAGQPLFDITFGQGAGSRDPAVTGRTDETRDMLDKLPKDGSLADPAEIVQAVMAALTPEEEIGASVAKVSNGRLDFKSITGVEPGTLQRLQEERAAGAEARAQAAKEGRIRTAVEGATVLKTDTRVGGPLKLKTP